MQMRAPDTIYNFSFARAHKGRPNAQYLITTIKTPVRYIYSGTLPFTLQKWTRVPSAKAMPILRNC